MKLTPQARFLFEMLSRPPASDVSILAIAVSMSGAKAAGWTPRQQQQRVGNRVSVLNKQLEKEGASVRVRPGDARRSYRIKPIELFE